MPVQPKPARPRSEEAKALERARDLPNTRTAGDADTLKRAFADNLQFAQGTDEHSATDLDRYFAVAYAVRDRMMRRWIQSQQRYYEKDAKRVYYLSMEFLIGRMLENNLINLGLHDSMRSGLADLGLDLADLAAQERDAGLGNGGLGRLAACFLDSMATLALPATGYGIRYEFGIFDQEIREGHQVERPEEWLRFGCAWELPRPEHMVPVQLYGRTESYQDEHGGSRVRWVDARRVLGMPYDLPVAGYGPGATVNTLRLWRARAAQELDLADFNAGDYLRAVEERDLSENISKVLYPNDLTVMGKELRLQQQYFFVACSIHDIVSRHLKIHDGFRDFPDKVAIQLNDTHPAVAVVELMRVLVDLHDLPWDEAWEICRATFGYTNHTLLPEALERWSVDLFGRVLPRHLELIYEVNRRFLDECRRAGASEQAVERMSLLEEGPVKKVRMANLAVIGSHSVNGVAALHTELLKRQLFHDFDALWPAKFNNKTNGVTPRRWLLAANPELSSAISEAIGPGWVTDALELKRLEPLAADAGFRRLFRRIKRENKARLADIIRAENGLDLDLDMIFDVQVKRIHEYKRQLLAILRVVAEYQRMKADPGYRPPPRAYLFGGKAAPGYAMAKAIIHLINAVAEVVNGDPAVRGRMAVAFLRNFRVSLAERIYPAADLSEQISTAGKEASGTGNMKFALNGALTIGTLDGANVEIREQVGAENFFLFGLTVEEVQALRGAGYRPADYPRRDPVLGAVMAALAGGDFSGGDGRVFQPIVRSLLESDPYLVLADFAAFRACQDQVSAAWGDPERWTRMAILNVARTGTFSSDRTIRQYAEEIWKVRPVPLE
jgi:glycogen phosphorylase